MAVPILIALGAALIGGCLSTREVGPPADGDSPVDAGRHDTDKDMYSDVSADSGLPDLGPDACTVPALFRDFDGDGYGNPEESSEGCLISKEGYVDNALDCNDDAPEINPDAMELHNDSVDNDCDEIVDIDSWRMVAAGQHHSCGLGLDGGIRCWGRNDDGQAPEEVLPGEMFTQVCSGGSHSCGLLESGNIYCWGTLTLPSELVDETFNFVGCGLDNACGIREADDTGVCWGSDAEGQSTLPIELEEAPLSQITSGWRHTCALKADNTVTCWGLNAAGQVTSTPEGIPFSQISSGWQHNCGIFSSDSTADCWGDEENKGVPGDIPPELLDETFNQIRAGWFLSCGLLITGVVECWGADEDGQSTPPLGESFLYVGESKGNHVCGVNTEDVIRCWGNNDYGQAPDFLSL